MTVEIMIDEWKNDGSCNDIMKASAFGLVGWLYIKVAHYPSSGSPMSATNQLEK